MFCCQIDHAIVEIANSAFMNPGLNPEDGVYVRARVFVRTYPHAERDVSRFLHFVFRRLEPGTTATNVWFQLGNETGFIPDDAAWQNTSSHDSCWSSDGVRLPITRAYFDLCDKVAPNKAPIELTATAHIDHVAVVKIQVKPVGDGYHQTLVHMER
jgi:hypothetical protein